MQGGNGITETPFSAQHCGRRCYLSTQHIFDFWNAKERRKRRLKAEKQIGTSGIACSCNLPRQQRAPVARSSPSSPEDARQLPGRRFAPPSAPRRASPFFFESRSFRSTLSSIVSASNSFRRAFSYSPEAVWRPTPPARRTWPPSRSRSRSTCRDYGINR